MDCGAAYKPPGIAARGLAEWAMDLWPFVNGKALVSGLDLKEMEVSDMLDVIHFFFEEDHRYHTAEEAKGTDSMRSALYETMYKTKFKYSTSGSSNTADNTSGFAYSSNETKPYIPPTEFDPEVGLQFGRNLEAPLR